VIDARGDYVEIEQAVVLGAADRPPDPMEATTALKKPEIDAVVTLAALPPPARPAFVADLLRRLGALRQSTGRPHWIVVDEAELALPARALREEIALPPAENTIFVSSDATRLAPDLLAAANAIVATGGGAGAAIVAIARAISAPAPPEALRDPLEGEALVWFRRSGAAPVLVQLGKMDSAKGRERADVGRLLRRA
ncbi:MAG TPA: hypothetical protein VFO24_08650, partial [Usitatibacter sp.]|nr:hypothetical protein [Usitatibacter sp.]